MSRSKETYCCVKNYSTNYSTNSEFSKELLGFHVLFEDNKARLCSSKAVQIISEGNFYPR